MLIGILGADDAAFHQPAHVGMIAGETQDARAADEIEAAVSDVREIKLPVADDESSAGGTHPLEWGILLGILLNAGVSRVKRLDESRLRIVARGLLINFANGLNGQTAGFLAAFMATHTVG